jgi:hypothetical protein
MARGQVMRMRAGLRLLWLVGGLSAALPLLTAHGPALAEDTASEVLSPLVALTMDQPGPVQGADGRSHLVYELLLVNFAADPVELISVETLDAASGASLGTIEAGRLDQVLRLNGGLKGSALPAGSSAILFMDVTYASTTPTPKGLKHRFRIAVKGASKAAASDGDRDPTPAPPQTLSFVGADLNIGRPAVIVAPPLKGSRWVVAGGCCDTIAIIAALPCRSMAASMLPSDTPSTSCRSTHRIASHQVPSTSFRATGSSAPRSTRWPMARSSASKTVRRSRCPASCRRTRRSRWRPAIIW